MVENNFLPLDLKESLFFETGYEVGEMISISLDPEISIQTFNDYVSIRGIIALEGKYLKIAEEEADHEEERRVEHIHRSIAKIATANDEEIQFYHHFPIEISVPFERISKIDDVTVSVESFDYTLPRVNEMKIAAMLHINGIQQDKPLPKQPEEVSHPNVELGDTFQFEIVNKREEAKNETNKNKSTDDSKDMDEKLPMKHDLKEEETEEIREASDQEATDKEEAPAKEPKAHEAELSKSSSEELPEIERLTDQTESINISEQTDLSEDEASAESLEDATYLTEMFNGTDEDDLYQMKLCIVQMDETLNDIAERYDISPQKIIHLNKLDDEQILTGQILLIPLQVD